ACADIAPTLSSSGAGTSRTSNERTEADMLIAHSLTASAGLHGHSSPRGDGSDNLVVAFAQNQREEVRDLCDVATALPAETGTHQQTFVAQAVAFDIQQVTSKVN